MIIDFHTHVFPSLMAEKTLPEVSHRAKIDYFIDGSVNGLLDSMHGAGIDISAVSRITTKPEQVKSVNTWLRDIKYNSIIPMATWHPEIIIDPEWISELISLGFKCMKLHPDYQGFFADEKRIFPLYDAAQELGMPILFHAGLDRGLPPPVHATPEMLLKVHETFPRLTMIAAHMGGEDNYEDTEKYLLGRGIYLDTSFVLRKMPLGLLEHFMNKHPIEHILFGSDSPWADQAQELDYLFSLPFLKQREKEMIAGINAVNLLKLS
ncbi:amidohydrolase family protein [Deltaproteobacteria bacterium]|nr:amidohydrolase family protein [Deltaproteobacteria bacterium]